MKYFSILLIAYCSFSCSFLDFSDKGIEEPALVKFDDSYLYPTDLRGIGIGLSPHDSIQNVEKFIEDWIRNEVVLSEAKKDSLINKNDIEDKLKVLRRDLFIYEYEKNLLEKNQDTSISDGDVLAFFEANPSNFLLKQNIFNGYFIKINRKSPSFNKVKKLLKEVNKGGLVKLGEIVTQEANTYHIDTLIWHNFDDISRNTPFEKITNQKKYLKNNKFEVRYTKDFAFVIKILTYKLTSEIGPLEFHEEMIRNTLIHKNRRRLIQDNEENLYNKAKKEERFEIYF